jgi:3-hydroxybutyrate dehydrogenase
MTRIEEPEIHRDDFLILNDESYRPDNICVVTGAANGIGRATALAAAANRLTTVALDIDVGGGRRTEEMARQIGGRSSSSPPTSVTTGNLSGRSRKRLS